MADVIFFNYNSVFSSRLRELLDEAKISKHKLSEEIGVSRQAVSQYCDGSTVPNADKLLKIADYFGVSLDYLVGKTANKTPFDKPEGELIRSVCDYTGLNESAVKQLHSKLTFKSLLEENDKDYAEMIAEEKKSIFSFISFLLSLSKFYDAVGDIAIYMRKAERKLSRCEDCLKQISTSEEISADEVVDTFDIVCEYMESKQHRTYFFEAVERLKSIVDLYCKEITDAYNHTKRRYDYIKYCKNEYSVKFDAYVQGEYNDLTGAEKKELDFILKRISESLEERYKLQSEKGAEDNGNHKKEE